MAFFTVPVTLHGRTKSGTDGDGNDVYVTVDTATVGVYAPGGSVETLAGGETVTTQPTVYLPAPAPTALDAVTVVGLTLDVDGQPEDWSAQPNPFTGWVPDYPVVVRLKAVTG